MKHLRAILRPVRLCTTVRVPMPHMENVHFTNILRSDSPSSTTHFFLTLSYNTGPNLYQTYTYFDGFSNP